MSSTSNQPQPTQKKTFDLVESAHHYYYTMDLAEDGDDEIDPAWWNQSEGVEAVLKRAFGSSDCGHFAVVLHEMTGYPVCNLFGSDGLPIHSFVRLPDGRGLDVFGASDFSAIASRYGWKGNKVPPVLEVGAEAACGYEGGYEDVDDQGFDETKQRLVAVIRSLPWTPYSESDFRTITHRPLEGVDIPYPEIEPALAPCVRRPTP